MIQNLSQYYKRYRQDLTERENEIMFLISRGYSNPQISEKLCISDSTIRTHIANIYQKFHVSSTRKELRQSVTRLRAVLIYLKLAKAEAWINEE